jgi:predicted metal-dependent enzyme (double-stranded beta helix superfamily)
VTRNHREIVAALARRARVALEASEDPIDRIRSLEGVVAWAVKDPFWLGTPFRRVQGAGAYYLLWRDRDSAVSLIAMVLGPGDRTPIHDHLTWGVVGVYSGLQQDTRYIDRSGELWERSRRRRRPGDVTYILPPDNDIHFIASESSDTPAVSVFFMGSNLGCRPRHVYAEDGSRETVVSGYANVSCPDQTRSPFAITQSM